MFAFDTFFNRVTRFAMEPLGYTWLVRHFGLNVRPLSHASFVGTSPFRREGVDGFVEEHYIKRYDPGPDPLEHLVFALKRDGLDLDVMRKAFEHITASDVAKFVAKKPTGKYTRQIGFWFEFLTGKEVPLKSKIVTNYTPLLDPKKYLTARTPVREPKWCIANNAIGNRSFLPLIRKTREVQAIEATDWQAMIEEVVSPFPDDLLRRALSYLYFKETKSSFAIEREEAIGSKAERFIELLRRAGTEHEPLNEEFLTRLQNVIVEERYRENGYRKELQNFVAESTIAQNIVHLIGCPPPYLRDVMDGLEAYFEASAEVHPVIRAAAISFPFVFIHPFEDGNGRIHRYLIHDIMARGGIGSGGSEGLLIPGSPEILEDMRSYDECLERFSKPLLSAADYEIDKEGEMTVENPAEIEGIYRYPDVTPQVEYLAKMVRKAITESLTEEIQLLDKFDRVRHAVEDIVSMPDRKRESLIMRLYHNKGKLTKKRRRGEFRELRDDEIDRIEEAFAEVFEIPA